jgi:YcxB-like protein
MITLQYALTKEDYVNYYTYVSWDAPERKKKRFNYYARQIIPIILFIGAFYYTGIFERNSKFILLILGFIFLTLLLSLFNVRSNTVRQAQKVANDPGNSSIFLDISIIISETGISTKNAVAETKFQWSSFIKKQENTEYYFLFISSIQALIIPKRVFNNADERNQFEKLLSQYLSFDAEIGHLVKS